MSKKLIRRLVIRCASSPKKNNQVQKPWGVGNVNSFGVKTVFFAQECNILGLHSPELVLYFYGDGLVTSSIS